jgi:hypothetical protein
MLNFAVLHVPDAVDDGEGVADDDGAGAVEEACIERVSAVALKMSAALETPSLPPPPVKIATPSFGSDVAAKELRASLKFAVLQVPDVPDATF